MDKKKIGIFITGGIAAYKIPLLIRLLIKQNYSVRVAMTPAAQKFVTPETLATLSKADVLIDNIDSDNYKHVAHVELAHWMDLAIIVPATANTIAKLAHGLADNIVTTTLLAFNGPKLIFPAMNDQMFLNPATQANLEILRNYKYEIINPETGFLAEGYNAVGRMPEVETIANIIDFYQIKKPLLNQNIIISAGGTVEPIDSVRLITNRSSGKMGYALANSAAALGANVTLVTTKNLTSLPNINKVMVQTADEMKQEIDKLFPKADIVIMAAAVSDFKTKEYYKNKIKKDPTQTDFQLNLIKNPDILATLGQQKSHQYLVGFAAETNDLLENAIKKLSSKNADMIIANQVGAKQGFDKNENAVTILTNNQVALNLPLQTKKDLAFAIWKEIIKAKK